MKTRNFPEKVTKRRAEAFKRINVSYPDNYVEPITDQKFRLGRARRLKVAQKFI